MSITSFPATLVLSGDTAHAYIDFTVTNTGPDAATNVVLDLDPGLWAGGSSQTPPWMTSCTPSGTHTICTTASLDRGTYSAHLYVSKPHVSTATLTATVTIGADTPDPDQSNNTAAATAAVIWSAAMNLWNPTADLGATPGSKMSLGVVLWNNGPSNALDVELTFSLPKYAAFDSLTKGPAGMTCSAGESKVVCTDPVIDFFYEPVTMVVAIDPSAIPDTELAFQMTLTGSDLTGTKTATVTAHVFGPTDVSVSVAAPATAAAGLPMASTVTFTNNGPYAAYQPELTVTFTTDKGERLRVARPYVPGWACSTGNSETSCNCQPNYRTSFAPGTSITFPFKAYLDYTVDTRASSIETKAVITDPFDTNDGNGSSTGTTQVLPPPWSYVSSGVSAGKSYAKPGDLVTFYVSASNSVSTPAENVVLSVQIPSYVSIVSSDLPCPNPASCSLGTLGPLEYRDYHIVGQIFASNTTVTVRSTITASNDSHTPNVYFIGVVTVGRSTNDLSLQISAPAVVHPGPAQWTLTVSNSGPELNAAASVEIKAPAGTTFSRFVQAPPGAQCREAWNGIGCSMRRILAAGSSEDIVIELNVMTDTSSPLHFEGTVTTDDLDQNRSNDHAKADSVLVNRADLVLRAVPDLTTAPPDSDIALEYRIANTGHDAASAVDFSMTPPPWGVGIASLTSPSATCTNDFHCYFAAIAAGDTKVVFVNLRLSMNGLFAIQAHAGATNAETQTGSAMVRVRPLTQSAVDLSLAASVTPAVLYVGETATFTYYVTNRSKLAADDVNLEIHLPQQFAFASGSDGCDATHCSLGTIVSGDTVSATITAVATTTGYTCTDSRTSCAKAEVNEADNAASQLALILPPPTSRHRAAPH